MGLEPYQAYVYINIYCNQNEQMHCNVRFKGGSLIPWCYGVPIRARIQYKIHAMIVQHRNTTQKSSIKRKGKTSLY